MHKPSETALAEFIRYNAWANQQVIEACEQLNQAQLEEEIDGAFGSIYDTLVHVVSSETYYVRLMTGKLPEPPFDWEDRPSLQELKAFTAEVGEMLLDVVAQVPLDHPISEEWEGEELRYNALLVFLQVINHGIEHRTNITTVLNQQERNPPDVAGWGYLLGNRGRFDEKYEA